MFTLKKIICFFKGHDTKLRNKWHQIISIYDLKVEISCNRCGKMIKINGDIK